MVLGAGRQVVHECADAVAAVGQHRDRLIRRGLADVGKTADTEITAFTDGCSGLRSILVDAGVTAPPYLDWFRAT